MKTRIKELIAKFGIGFITLNSIKLLNGWVISPIIFRNYSLLDSFVLMYLLSLVVCYILIKTYDHTKKDWLLIESLKEKLLSFEDAEKYGVTRKIIRWKKLGKAGLIFCVLLYDPMVAVVYLREGYKLYDGIPNIKVFGLYLLSILMGNIFCICLMFGFFGVISLIFS